MSALDIVAVYVICTFMLWLFCHGFEYHFICHYREKHTLHRYTVKRGYNKEVLKRHSPFDLRLFWHFNINYNSNIHPFWLNSIPMGPVFRFHWDIFTFLIWIVILLQFDLNSQKRFKWQWQGLLFGVFPCVTGWQSRDMSKVW